MGLKEDATAKLNAAYDDAQKVITPTCKHKDFINFVIDNTHLTYKYVLLIGLPCPLKYIPAYGDFLIIG